MKNLYLGKFLFLLLVMMGSGRVLAKANKITNQRVRSGHRVLSMLNWHLRPEFSGDPGGGPDPLPLSSVIDNMPGHFEDRHDWDPTLLGDPIEFGKDITPQDGEVVSFEVQTFDEFVQIDWETGFEEETHSFIVQRSVDLFTWTNIDDIPSDGLSSTGSSYSTVDYEPPFDKSQTIFYRLKVVRNDEEYTFSGTEQAFRIEFNDAVTRVDPLFPNPAGGFVYIPVFVSEEKGLNVDVISLEGQLVKRMEGMQVHSGWTNAEVQVSDLAEGTYLLSLTFSTGEKMCKKLLIRR